jgi:hypothetical protein
MSFEIAMKVFRWAAPLTGGFLLCLTLSKLLQPTSLPRGFHLPGILLELVENENEAKAVRDASEDGRIRLGLVIDTFFFIPLYTSLFLVMGWWLAGRDVPFATWLGVVVCIGIVLAAGFDVLENVRTFELLRASSPKVLDGIRQAALVKWGTLFTLVLVLCCPFLRTGGWLLLVGLIYLITGVVGLLGVVWLRPLVEWGFMLIGLSLLVTGKAVRYIPSRI